MNKTVLMLGIIFLIILMGCEHQKKEEMECYNCMMVFWEHIDGGHKNDLLPK